MRRVAHPVPALVPKWSKIAPSWPQHGAKIKPKSSKIEPRWGPKMGYPIGVGYGVPFCSVTFVDYMSCKVLYLLKIKRTDIAALFCKIPCFDSE